MILGFMCMALIPAVAITVWTITITRTQAKQQALNHLDSVASLKYAQLISWLNNGASQLDLLLTPSMSMQIQQYVQSPPSAREEQAIINTFLHHALLAQTPYSDTARFQTFFLYDPAGRIVAASNPAYVGRVVHLQPYFAASLTINQVHPPYYAPDRLELVIVITKRIQAPNGATIGILGGQLDLAMLGSIMTSLNGLRQTGETYLVSHESQYLLTPSRFPDYPLTKSYDSVAIKRGLRGENGADIYLNYQSPPESVLGVYRWVPELQATLIAEMTEDEVLQRYLNARASGSLFFRWLEESDHAKLNLNQVQLDLILLDLQLPRENGYQIVQQIRQHPHLQQTRVIAVTANVMPVDVQRAQDAGFDGFIGKPIDKDRFPDQIRRILAGESVWEAF